jgi:hypothetical protein
MKSADSIKQIVEQVCSEYPEIVADFILFYDSIKKYLERKR